MLISIINLFIGVFLFYLLYRGAKKRYSLSKRIIISLFLGIGLGFLLKTIPHSDLSFGIGGILNLIGLGYLALLKMLVIPLILTSIIHAIIRVGRGNDNFLKKMSFTSIGMLLGMTALSSVIALSVGEFFKVGKGMTLPTLLNFPPAPQHHGIINTLLSMVPSNPVAVMANENTVAVVIFAVLLGIAARMLDHADHDKMETFSQFIASMFAIIKKLAQLVLEVTPYAIMSLMATLVASQGMDVLSGMITFVVAMYVAMALVFVMHAVILAFVGVNPTFYFKNAVAPLFVAFTTRSSFGTLPVVEETLRVKFKTNQVVATFVPSLGATIGMNACAGVFPAMLVSMAMAIGSAHLTPQIVVTVMFVNALASLGVSGIPGSAYIAATITLTSLNLPYAVIALVQGIDPIVDMGRTATNVNGVMTAALVTDRAMRKKD